MIKIHCLFKLKNKSIILKALLLLSVIMIGQLYDILNKPTINVHILSNIVDNNLPFVKYFVIPYIYWYLYVIIFLSYYTIYRKTECYNFLLALNIGLLICYLIYYFFPTHVPRPIIIEEDLFSNMVKWIYKNDGSYNCFPSIHVLSTYLIMIFMSKDYIIPKSIKVMSNLFGWLIIISTMLIKQHYIYDVIFSIFLSYLLYYTVLKIEMIKRIKLYISSLQTIIEKFNLSLK